MIDPDAYLDDALEGQRSRYSLRFARQAPNFQRLSTDRLLVPITLLVPVTPTFTLRDHFDWDLSDGYRSVDVFAEKLAGAIGLRDKEEISNQIYDQIVEHVEKYTMPTRARIRRPEDLPINSLTCMNCDTILYNNDTCRGCGISLEKLRQKYGQVLPPLTDAHTEEEEVAVRQTERQKDLESMRKKLDSTLNANGKKMCSRCGEANHALSWECRQCGKSLSKTVRKIKSPSEGLAQLLWKSVLRDSQFAQIISSSDMVKEEDFCSPIRLRSKLEAALAASHDGAAPASSRIEEMLELLHSTFYKVVLQTNAASLVTERPQEYEFDVKELDADNIHNAWEGAIQLWDEEVPVPPRPAETPKRRTRQRRNAHPRSAPASTIVPPQCEDGGLAECGVCNQPGTLLCCDVCPNVFHLACLRLFAVPRGRWVCFFCVLVRDGVMVAISTEPVYAEKLQPLIQRSDDWRGYAQQILNILLLHPCSQGLSTGLPDLSAIRQCLSEGDEFASLREVDTCLRGVWKQAQRESRRNSTRFFQAFTMQVFYSRLLVELNRLVGLPLPDSSKDEEAGERQKTD